MKSFTDDYFQDKREKWYYKAVRCYCYSRYLTGNIIRFNQICFFVIFVVAMIHMAWSAPMTADDFDEELTP